MDPVTKMCPGFKIEVTHDQLKCPLVLSQLCVRMWAVVAKYDFKKILSLFNDRRIEMKESDSNRITDMKSYYTTLILCC